MMENLTEQQKVALEKINARRLVCLSAHSKSLNVYNSLVKAGLASRLTNAYGYEFYPKGDLPK